MPTLLLFLAWYNQHVLKISYVVCLLILGTIAWGCGHYGWRLHHG